MGAEGKDGLLQGHMSLGTQSSGRRGGIAEAAAWGEQCVSPGFY